MTRHSAAPTRARILAVAGRLFSQHGVRAVGVQRVNEEVGFGKSALYREFPSKDDLVAEWLREADADWWRRAEQHVAQRDGDPVEQMVALIEFVQRGASSPTFNGCIFYNTSAEFRDPRHPGRRVAVDHLSRIRSWLHKLATEAGSAEPQQLSEALMLIVGGVLANSQALGSEGPAQASVPVTRLLIAGYCS